MNNGFFGYLMRGNKSGGDYVQEGIQVGEKLKPPHLLDPCRNALFFALRQQQPKAQEKPRQRSGP